MTFFNDGKTTLKILLIKIILRPPAGFTEQSELIKNSYAQHGVQSKETQEPVR